MSARPGDKLVGGYVPAAFAGAVERFAKAARVSKSDVIRQGITRELLTIAEERKEDRDREEAPYP